MEAGYGDRTFSSFQFSDGHLHVFCRGKRPGLDLIIVGSARKPKVWGGEYRYQGGERLELLPVN